MVLAIQSEVRQGKLSDQARNAIVKALRDLEGKRVAIDIKLDRNTRSNKQNRYMYGQVYKLAAKGLEDTQGGVWSMERTKRELKIAVGHYEEYVGINGEVVKEPLPTPKMDTLEFTQLIDRMRMLCFEFMGIDIPNPDGAPYSDNLNRF